MLKRSTLNQIGNVLGFLCIAIIGFYITGFWSNEDIDPFEKYGSIWTSILYAMKMFTFMGMPILCLNIVGNLLYRTAPEEQTLRGAPLLCPFISIRVVTRGSYPDLVRRNVERNLRVCEEFGLDKFVIEVVTDRPIYSSPEWPSMRAAAKVREIVVPADYRTNTGAKYKARALQYALEPHVSILNDDDWIVHLDEETLLTHSALIGIFNFLHDNK